MKPALFGPRRFAGAISAMVVWAGWFTAVYALQGIGCDAGWHLRSVAGGNLLSLVLLATGVVALALIAWIGVRGWRAWQASAAGVEPGGRYRGQVPFTSMLMVVLALMAAIGTVLVAVPILMLGPCQA